MVIQDGFLNGYMGYMIIIMGLVGLQLDGNLA